MLPADLFRRLDESPHTDFYAMPRLVTHIDDAGRLQAIPGVGRIVGLTVLTHLPELGTLDRKRITALAGLAPFACESGLQRGRRAIWRGRGDARAMLFLAAQSA